MRGVNVISHRRSYTKLSFTYTMQFKLKLFIQWTLCNINSSHLHFSGLEQALNISSNFISRVLFLTSLEEIIIPIGETLVKLHELNLGDFHDSTKRVF